MVEAGYLSVYRITESPPSHPVFVSNEWLNPVGTKRALSIHLGPLRGERGYFHRVDGIMTWAEGRGKIVIKLTIDEAIGVVTRLYKLRIIFDYVNVVDDTCYGSSIENIYIFDRKIIFLFFFFLKKRQISRNIVIRRWISVLILAYPEALNFDIE